MAFTSYGFAENTKVAVCAEVSALYTSDTETHSREVLDAVAVGNVVYLAVRETTKATAEVRVFAGVCEFNVVQRGGVACMGYHQTTEDEQPMKHNCPDSIMALLTPTNVRWAQTWREFVAGGKWCHAEAVRQQFERKQEWVVGSTVRFSPPARVKVDGKDERVSEFVFVGYVKRKPRFQPKGTATTCTIDRNTMMDARFEAPSA